MRVHAKIIIIDAQRRSLKMVHFWHAPPPLFQYYPNFALLSIILLYLLQLDDVLVHDVAPRGREERDGREQQHHVLVRPPPGVKPLDEALVFLVEVDPQVGGLLQKLQTQLARAVFGWELELEKKKE